jgi:hypothetical protein
MADDGGFRTQHVAFENNNNKTLLGGKIRIYVNDN